MASRLFTERMSVSPGAVREEPREEHEFDRIAAQQEAERTRRIQIEQRVETCVSRLSLLAQEQVNKKNIIELRWLENLRAYHGRYDRQTETELANANKSRLFVKITRAKTHGWEARLGDMLFPTDDKNWGIKPTPVSTLTQAARDAVRQRDAKLNEANTLVRDGRLDESAAVAMEADRFAQAARQRQEEADEAKRRAELMERTIDDQFVESRYPTRSREVIHDACKLGTGIMKGPVVSNRLRKHWRPIQAPGGKTIYKVVDEPIPAPEFRRVDPWSFFPDMSARHISEAEFTFERYLMTQSQLRALAKQPGFIKESIAELLRAKPREGVPTYIAELRSISGVFEQMEARYQVWEYHGCLELEEWVSILQAAGDVEQLQEVADNPLEEYRCVLWFCDGKLIKYGEHPEETGEGLYSVFCFEQDDSCIFGFGVPHLMEDSQKALNAAWRMMMDNAALSVGPQVVIDKTQIIPQNGKWALEARKIWLRIKTGVAGASPAFETYTITNNQAELAAIIELARRFADEETSMPVIAQGDQASHVTNTASGMSMLMNSANVVFRRIVKEFDDNMTIPNVRRAYNWNMAFNDDDSIKGDMDVDARGSSVLLVRELQAQNLMAIMNNWGGHPVFGQLLKVAPTARKTVQAMMISAEDVIKTDDELKREADAAAQNPPPPGPEEIKFQIAELEMATRKEIATMQRDTAMMKIAEDRNMTVDQVAAMLEKARMERDGKERILAAEVAIEEKRRAEDRADGVKDSEGSGGYV